MNSWKNFKLNLMPGDMVQFRREEELRNNTYHGSPMIGLYPGYVKDMDEVAMTGVILIIEDVIREQPFDKITFKSMPYPLSDHFYDYAEHFVKRVEQYPILSYMKKRKAFYI